MVGEWDPKINMTAKGRIVKTAEVAIREVTEELAIVEPAEVAIRKKAEQVTTRKAAEKMANVKATEVVIRKSAEDNKEVLLHNATAVAIRLLVSEIVDIKRDSWVVKRGILNGGNL
mmetsp:Transcript_23952/g.34310  ORF Transcript_23952/g.34310 Transcript_23952/m.34310 type:complete len:116 (+) Transcript_23952:954-1301(+)